MVLCNCCFADPCECVGQCVDCQATPCYCVAVDSHLHTITGNLTVDPAKLRGQYSIHATAAATITFPAAEDFFTEFGSTYGIPTDYGFIVIADGGAATVAVTAPTGTSIGSMSIANGTSGSFTFVHISHRKYVIYRRA